LRLAAAALLVLAAGCAPPVLRPSPGELKIGETTQEQVTQRMGSIAPQRAEIERNGRKVQVYAYGYDAQYEAPHGYDGVIPLRTMFYYFLDGRLVGHEFNSSVERDNTDFSARNVRNVVRGQTTRDEVLQLFGRPAGVLAYPLVDARGGALVYTYRESRRVPFGKPTQYSKTLMISFEESGVVHDLSYTTSGTP
jgi:hypothetical protein